VTAVEAPGASVTLPVPEAAKTGGDLGGPGERQRRRPRRSAHVRDPEDVGDGAADLNRAEGDRERVHIAARHLRRGAGLHGRTRDCREVVRERVRRERVAARREAGGEGGRAGPDGRAEQQRRSGGERPERECPAPLHRPRMVAATRSSVPGRELAALGRDGRASAMAEASVTAWRREVDGSGEAVQRPHTGRERPGLARSRIRTREIVAAII